MFRKMLLLTGIIGGMIGIATMCQAVLVDGYCYLENQTDHSGTKVLFQADSPGAVTDSTFTDASGYYQKDLAVGAYDVFFSHDGYFDDEILDQLFLSPATLPDVTLIEMIGTPISGSLSGILPSDTYIVEGDIWVDYDSSLTIEAGAIFHFTSTDSIFYVFAIYGELYAQGTEWDSIKFMPAPVDTAWEGIDFYYITSDSSRLEYCFITGSHSCGIYCEDSSPSIENCTISGNSSEWDGGGIYCFYSSPTIANCTINGNYVGEHGGGIYCSYYSSPTITNCTISGNSADWSGGGIFCDDHSSPSISYCTISGNSSGWGGHGGGIYCFNSNPTISYCTISGNSSVYDAGGIICDYYSSLSISYCTISENSAANWAGGIFCNVNSNLNISHCTISGNSAFYGGGIYCYYSSPSIENCTISGNSSGDLGGGIYCDSYSSPTLVNTIVEGNTGSSGIYFGSPNAASTFGDFYNNEGGNFSGNPPQWLGQIVTVNANGDSCDLYYNIFADPLFYATSGDSAFYLAANSPCIDAGDPTYPLDPDSTVADIGAFYFDQGAPPAEPNIEVSASLLNFDSVAVGNQADLPLTIYNIGLADLILYSLVASDPAFSSNFNPADSLIAPGDSLLITVTFSPAEITFYIEFLTIDNNDTTTVVALQGTGIGPVDVTLTPYGAPIIIPATGGSFDFNIAVENLTAATQTFDLWTEVVLPGVGSVPILNITGITLPGVTAIDRDRTQAVPDYAPAGTYTYYAYVGSYPWVVDAYDSFTFSKESSDAGGSLGSPSDWLCSGESFAEWKSTATGEFPAEFSLNGVYPNPFNPLTTIRFGLPEAVKVNLSVYDISGRGVATLVDGWQEAGFHEVTFDGSGLASGMYFFRLKAGEFEANGKMLLMK